MARIKHGRFPYSLVEKMWKDGNTISEIAKRTGYIDKDNPKDPYHSLRNFLHRMHKGYIGKGGHIVRLPHRVPKGTVAKCRKAGLRAW